MNSVPTNRIIIIIIALLVVAAIGVGVYFGLQGAKQAATPGQSSGGGTFPLSSGSNNQGSGALSVNQGQPDQSAPSAALQQQKNNLFQLTTNPAAVFWVASSTTSTSGIIRNAVYYMNAKGDVVQIQDIGREQTIAGSSFGTPLRLWQNKSGSKIVVLFDSRTYALFDIKTKAWDVLPAETMDVAFSPDGAKLAILKELNGQAIVSAISLGTARRTSTTLVSLAMVDVKIYWPSASRLFFVSRSSSGVDGQVWYFDLTKKTLNYVTHGDGLAMVFGGASPSVAAQFVASPNGTSMAVSFLDGENKQRGSLTMATIADKCIFALDGKRFFCGVPRENDKGNDLNILNDYVRGDVYFHDSLYSIGGDAFSSLTPLVTASDVLLDVVSLWATATQLFFINRLDHTVYLYNLPTS
ncbi:MAG: hypothetical protein WC246_00155 [Candidatus Paceibacterota bacterium]|jgi:hypothetical protein